MAESDPTVIGIDRGGSEEMVTRAEELGLGDRFRLIPPVEDVRTVHGAGDVMVSSSREEGMAYAVLESLASGTPVVATAIPGHAILGDQPRRLSSDHHRAAGLGTRRARDLDRTPEQAAKEAEDAHAWMEEHLAHVPVARRVIALVRGRLSAHAFGGVTVTATGTEHGLG